MLKDFSCCFLFYDDSRLRDFSYYSAKAVNPLIQGLLAGGSFTFFIPAKLPSEIVYGATFFLPAKLPSEIVYGATFFL